MVARLHSTTFAIGLLAGALGGLVGLGGGVVMIPLLILYGTTRHQAHATSLAAVIATGAIGAIIYGLDGRVDFFWAAILAVSALIAASAGARTASTMSPTRLRQVFGGALITVALLLLAKPWYADQLLDPTSTGAWIGLLVTGTLAGYMAGLLGVGGGSIMVPGLVLLGGLDQHHAQGTALLAMVPAAIIGTWTHARHHALALDRLPGLIPGVILGGAGGATLAQLLPELWLRLAFAGFLVWLGWRDLRPSPGLSTAIKSPP